MDYEKTISLYEKYNLRKAWEQLPENADYAQEVKWFEAVKSKRSGEYWQVDELRNRELVSADWEPPHKDSKGKPVRYPIKTVNSIHRRRTVDGTEWLLSRQMWYGLDSLGNVKNISMDDKEYYDNILPVYKSVDKNPKDKDSQIVKIIDHLEHRRKYTLPFTPDNLQRLYDMRVGKCSLIVIDETAGDYSPILVEDYEQFKGKSFNELWAMIKPIKQNFGN